MSIDVNTVRKIAHLARVEVTEAEEAATVNDLNRILEWMEALNRANTEGLEPLRHMSTEVNMLRNDEVKLIMTHEEALVNAPKKDSDYVRVPKVIE